MANGITQVTANTGSTTAAPAVTTQINTDAISANEGTQQYQDMVNDAVPAEAGGNSTVGNALAVAGGAGNLNQNNTVGLESAQGIANDPASFLTPELTLSGNTPTIDPTNGLMDPTAEQYQMDTGGLNAGVAAAGTSTISSAPQNQGANTYEAAAATGAVLEAQGTASQGSVSEEAIVTAEQIDMQGTATGVNADGTKNYTGQALTEFASQNISTMIDTSTVAGKLLAQELGEGNYTDTKSTVVGQLGIISKQFEGPNGEARIPPWAQATARNVSRIAAFKGMTGTAATAAMSTAIMEATLPIAQQEAQFMQTLTVKNLDNRQQSTINRANVLSKMDQLNLDARMQTAITNSKNFMEMDLANLSNEQQMAVVNTQARVQSILEDSKSENAARAFGANADNDFQKFYDELGSSISKFNAEQMNNMAKFNAGEINDNSEFNATLENNREQYYRTMQYNIDLSNAKWRQDVTMKETEMSFEAAALDVKNLFDITTESMNRLWDRADAILDYAWKAGESELDRENRIAVAQLQAPKKKSGLLGAIGNIFGAVAGSEAGSTAIVQGAKWLLGLSDERLKKNIVKFSTLKNGINVYRWEWNDEGKHLAGDQPTFGVLAQEVQKIVPEAVNMGSDGYLRVNYGMIVQ